MPCLPQGFVYTSSYIFSQLGHICFFTAISIIALFPNFLELQILAYLLLLHWWFSDFALTGALLSEELVTNNDVQHFGDISFSYLLIQTVKRTCQLTVSSSLFYFSLKERAVFIPSLIFSEKKEKLSNFPLVIFIKYNLGRTCSVSDKCIVSNNSSSGCLSYQDEINFYGSATNCNKESW